MPIVGGKRALMELVVRSRKLDKYSMISKLKPVKQHHKDKWLKKCKELGYIEMDHDLKEKEKPWSSK
jgi:hypothetical protein